MTALLIRGRLLSFKRAPLSRDDAESYAYEPDGAVLVVDGEIRAAGSYGEVLEEADDGVPEVDHRPHLILPGFIDTHIHFPQSQVVASYAAELLDWLRRRPLLHHDAELGFTLVHAGLPPQWDLPLAQRSAAELETVLRGPDGAKFLGRMFGGEPRRWRSDLSGDDRLRFIVNALTRIRFCTVEGALSLAENGPPGSQSKGLLPWFAVPGRRSADLKIIFGHWAALGYYRAPGIYALDSGCVWGNRLTAIRLDAPDVPAFSVPAMPMPLP